MAVKVFDSPGGQIKEFTETVQDAYEEVEVQIAQGPGGLYTLWVNVDGVCHLRATGIPVEKLQVLLPNGKVGFLKGGDKSLSVFGNRYIDRGGFHQG